MREESIVEEVRRHRRKLAARFGFDVVKIGKDAQRREKKGRHKVLPPPSKRAAV